MRGKYFNLKYTEEYLLTVGFINLTMYIPMTVTSLEALTTPRGLSAVQDTVRLALPLRSLVIVSVFLAKSITTLGPGIAFRPSIFHHTAGCGNPLTEQVNLTPAPVRIDTELPMVAEVVEKSECSAMTSSLLVIEGGWPATGKRPLC